MSKLSSIITGAKPGPRRMLVYGTAGIGKSTFATNAPAPIVIQTEDATLCERLANSVRSHPIASALLAEGMAEGVARCMYGGRRMAHGL